MFWHVTSDSPLYLSGHRPDVSISRALPLALASSGILIRWWHPVGTSSVRMKRRESHQQVTPFPVFIARACRMRLSTGFEWRRTLVSVTAASALSCALLAPACQPLTLGGIHDGSTVPSLALSIDAC